MTITRDLDTGDTSHHYVIPASEDWTLGWALDSEGSYSFTTPNHEGSMTITYSPGGASYLAGLTVSGLAVLALMLSH